MGLKQDKVVIFQVQICKDCGEILNEQPLSLLTTYGFHHN